ncbi:hypothetical protein LR48_Vigan01g069400 [Vigna angularis]|uniref:Pentacotripeptide-repeat region of PRORP domain-containing protein n=1 Tax=Phaseolus angularis TaxID=3914 RepID=A0A0L9TLV5_PHAAN|nr:hypothetical protein LR48_Vigan01g069400 [Vigna angularis]
MVAKDVTPCVWSYSSKLMGLAKNKNKSMSDAVKLFNKMKEEYVMPDIFCVNAIIQGFVNEDNLDKAKEWFNEIKNFNLYPHKSTFDILVPFLLDKLFHEGMDLEAVKIVVNAKTFLYYELNVVDEKNLAAIHKYYGC